MALRLMPWAGSHWVLFSEASIRLCYQVWHIKLCYHDQRILLATDLLAPLFHRMHKTHSTRPTKVLAPMRGLTGWSLPLLTPVKMRPGWTCSAGKNRIQGCDGVRVSAAIKPARAVTTTCVKTAAMTLGELPGCLAKGMVTGDREALHAAVPPDSLLATTTSSSAAKTATIKQSLAKTLQRSYLQGLKLACR